jgi:hypothetical protein
MTDEIKYSVADYEEDVKRLMGKLIRAQEKGTGSKLSSEDVALLWLEFGLQIEEVHDRAVKETTWRLK